MYVCVCIYERKEMLSFYLSNGMESRFISIPKSGNTTQSKQS